MGCFQSVTNRVQVLNTFTSDDISYLNQTWSILKTHDVIKFADEVLIRLIFKCFFFGLRGEEKICSFHLEQLIKIHRFDNFGRRN